MGNPNVTATAQNVSLGSGISFLIADSNNWLAAVGVESDTYFTYSYSYTAPYTYSAPYTYDTAYTSGTPLGYYASGTTYYYSTVYQGTGNYVSGTNYSWDGAYVYSTRYQYVTAGFWDHGTYSYYAANPGVYGAPYYMMGYSGLYTGTQRYVVQYGSYSTYVQPTYSSYSVSSANTGDVSSPYTAQTYTSYSSLGSYTNYSPYYSGTYSSTGSYATSSTYTATGSATNTNIRYLLKIYQSAAGTISTLATTTLSGILASLKVVVHGTSVTATAFSDNAQTTSVGTATTTLGSSPTATKTGIILTTSDQAQGSTLGYFTATITG
jgi:hypothetical protein